MRHYRHAFHGTAFVCAVQQDAVDPGDGAAAVLALVVVQVLSCDAQSFQNVLHLHLVLLQLAGLGLHQIERVKLKGLHGWREVHRLQPLAGHDLVYGEAISRLWLQDATEQLLARLGHKGRDDVGAVQDAAFQLGHGVGAERHGGRHHEEEHDAQCPHVHARAHVMLVTEELGCGVRRRATERVEGLLAPAHCAETKVSNLDTGAAGVEHILRLQVAVNDIVVMLQGESVFISFTVLLSLTAYLKRAVFQVLVDN